MHASHLGFYYEGPCLGHVRSHWCLFREEGREFCLQAVLEGGGSGYVCECVYEQDARVTD